jgi:hypothetical protein
MTRGSSRTTSGRPSAITWPNSSTTTRSQVHLALKIADRGYVLSHGELAVSGSAEQLSQDSALLAASYLGGNAGDATG